MRHVVSVALIAAVAAIAPALAEAPVESSRLTLRALTLTQGGVGVFSYGLPGNADTQGAATLTLSFPVSSVADALRSVRVRDPAGPAREVTVPTGATALPLDQPSWLEGLRGAAVTITQTRPAATAAGPVAVRGRIVRADRVEATTTQAWFTRLTLLTDAGLTQVALYAGTDLKFDDPTLRDRIAEALPVRDGDPAKPTRTLRIDTADGGARPVQVDVVLPVPLWKPTWRLALGAPAADGTTTARLQGWAVVENTGATDWNAITLRLVAGNPVTIDNDVYAVIDVPRPVVAVAAPTRIAPTEDTRVMAVGAAVPAPPPAPMMAMRAAPGQATASPVPPPARASEAAATSIFALTQTVDLPAGQTASLPFLDTDLPARLIDSLEPDAPHPIVAARIENTTGHTLPAGAVSTSASGSLFAGDAVLGTLPAGQSRLLAFAEDGAVDAAWDERTDEARAGLTAADGVLTMTMRERSTTTVTLDGAADGPRTVLVGVTRSEDAILTADTAKPFERTADQWRFLIPLKAGEHRVLTLAADRLLSSTMTLIDAETPTLVALSDDRALPAATRTAIGEIVALRADVATAEAARAAVKAERQRLGEDEDRVRRNLTAVPPTDPFHARLLANLSAAEDRMATLSHDADIADGRAREADARLRAAVASLRL